MARKYRWHHEVARQRLLAWRLCRKQNSSGIRGMGIGRGASGGKLARDAWRRVGRRADIFACACAPSCLWHVCADMPNCRCLSRLLWHQQISCAASYGACISIAGAFARRWRQRRRCVASNASAPRSGSRSRQHALLRARGAASERYRKAREDIRAYMTTVAFSIVISGNNVTVA